MTDYKVLNETSLEFLKKYIDTPSPTGYEKMGQQAWLEYIRPWIDEHLVDNYGNVAGIINPGQNYKVVIEAHADEVSWMVHYISEKGFLYLKRNGGSDHQIAPSKKVIVHTEKGLVEGVFGWPAIHSRKAQTKEETPSTKNIFVDVGCDSKEEVEKAGIHVGCIVSYPDSFTILNNRYFTGRALDNRLGGFAIAETARYLKEQNISLPFSLYVVNAVQEEVGMRGAQMITETIRPDVALITDVCHDTQSPMMDKQSEGDFTAGKGPVLTYAPAVQNNLRNLIIKSAEKAKIPFQRLARERITGTDTDAFAYSNGGVPSALMSMPIRYMHTTVETAHKDDVENLILLFAETLQNIKNGHDFRYFK